MPVPRLCRSCRGQATFGEAVVGGILSSSPALALLGGVARLLLAQPALWKKPVFLRYVWYTSLVCILVEECCFIYSTIISQYVIVARKIHMTKSGPITTSLCIVVVGMTTWVGQGQSHLPADVPGITTALGQRGQLQQKGRLHQQPAGDFTVEARAGANDKTPPTEALPKAAWPRQDRKKQETSVTPATLGLHQPMGTTLLHERI
jgi:hypothetical protein